METIHEVIPEASAASLLSIVGTLVQVLFLLIAAILPNVSSAWMNWLMTAALPTSVLGLFFWKAKYSRLEKDLKKPFNIAFVDEFGLA